MAEEVAEPQYTTLAERIAALNKQKNFKEPPPTAGKRPPPPPPGPARTATAPAVATTTNPSTPRLPSVPPRPTRTPTDNGPPSLPRRATEEVPGRRSMAPPPPAPVRGGAPPLPSRTSQQLALQAPKVPTRRPSGQDLSGRRGSNSSDASYISTMSSLSLNGTSDPSASGRRLPPTLDQAKLPPLPPTRRDREAAEAATTSPSLPSRASRITEPPVMPPRLPSRPTKSSSSGQVGEPSPSLPARRLPPPPSVYRPHTSALQNGFNPRKPANDDAPPPIPLNSRPTRDQIDAVSSRIAISRPPPSVPASQADCLVCRDFSAPDHVATQYPISALPRHDVVGYLARSLCDPFPSLTDKARAIFTWCHHNIAYDVGNFFGGTISHVTPEDSIFSGKAVCSGYSGVYEAIALRAGLECLVVTGHGKGFGYTPLKPGEPVPPPDYAGHAWNAVRIDGGRWKLLDACWGAGAVGDDQQYHPGFTPAMFTLSNDFLGLRHFPEDPAHMFREDGRRMSWEEYYRAPCDGEPAQFYPRATEEGLHEFTFEPRPLRIPVHGGEDVVRFRFGKICAHWTPERNGKGKQLLFALQVHGVDGRKDDLVALESDGFWFWVDVRARELGCPGQKVYLYGFETIGGKDARGVTREEWLRVKGRKGYSLVGIAMWELV